MAKKNKNNNSLVFADNGYQSYVDFSKLSFADKLRRRLNIAKAQFDNGSLAKAGYALVGGYDPENPRLNTGEPTILPSRGVNPKTVQNVAKGVRTLEDYLKTTKVTAQALEGSSAARGTYATDRYLGGVVFENNLPEAASQIQGHGMAKASTLQENLARLRYILDNGLEKGKTFFTAPLKVSDARIGSALGTGGGKPYFDGHFLITGKPGQMINSVDDIGTIYINDAYENEEALKAAQKIKAYLQQTYPNRTFKLYSEGFKQGGKMNVLEFLKNGSGIHIKEKNKGKFTSYCGGKVTDECIRKAKASGNPTLVKRATFAANARKWKHKEGGKAFVTGINVLDSNPKAYKEVKKKYKMRSAQQGTKMNFFQKANNFLSSDLGKGLSNSLINGIGNIVSSVKATKATNAQNEALDTQLKAHKAKTFIEKYNENLQNQTNKSPIVRQSNAWNQTNSQVSSEDDFEKEINRQKLINEEFAKQAQADAWYTTASNITETAINALNKNGVPKTASSPSYFDNYVNTKYKKFGTFNPDGSMNMLGGTFTIKGGYKPNQPQLFNYQPLKLNV